jgi:hypothetical protein
MIMRRIVSGAALVGMLLAPMIGARAAVPEDDCFAETPVVLGWGGLPAVPIPPQGIGVSCSFSTVDATILTGVVRGTFLPGGIQIILPDGQRFFCREPVSGSTLSIVRGLTGLPLDVADPRVYCGYGLGMVEIRVSLTSPFTGSIYCSTTGEVGLRIELACLA